VKFFDFSKNFWISKTGFPHFRENIQFTFSEKFGIIGKIAFYALFVGGGVLDAPCGMQYDSTLAQAKSQHFAVRGVGDAAPYIPIL